MMRLTAALLFGVLLLSGCSGMITVENDVRAYSTLPAIPARATYRFERLPSQQADPSRQDRIEAIARQALAGVGMQFDDADPAYSVQVEVHVQYPVPPPWSGPWPAWGFPGRYIVTPRGNVVWLDGFGGFGPYDGFYGPPWYLRTIRLTMRDLASSRIVYQTDAREDGPWANTDAILPAMFEAALRGFPNPPQGPHRVDIQIPR
ncbi:MAG: DUF4136 domain-containing protein [Burkholderiales bacterium]|nr:DUF4136 domain-containing protein [Burkholderiales bacterium]